MDKALKNTNITIYAISELLNKGLSFVLIPIFANLIPPDEFSKIGSYTVIYALLVLGYGLNLSASVLIFRYEQKQRFESILASNLLVVYIWAIILSGIIYANKKSVSVLFSVNANELMIAAGAAFFSVLFLNILAMYQSLGRSILYSILSLAKSLLSFIPALAIAVYLNEDKYLGFMYGQLIGCIVLFMASVYIISQLKNYEINLRDSKYLFFVSLPLIPHTLSGIIYSQYDRIIVKNYLGDEQAGIYFFSSNFLIIMQTLIAALNVGWSPMMINLVHSDAQEKIKFYLYFLSKIILFAGITVILWVNEIVDITSSDKYVDAIKIIPIFALSGYFYFINVMYTNINLWSKKAASISAASIAVAFISYYLNVYCVSNYGSTGVAYASLLIMLILLFLSVVISKDTEPKYKDAVKINYFTEDIVLIIIVFACCNFSELNMYKNYLEKIIVYFLFISWLVYGSISYLKKNSLLYVKNHNNSEIE